MTQSVATDVAGTRGVLVRIFSVEDLVVRHGLLDGTWIVSVLVPLWFALVLGDVGFGLIMLAAVYGTRLAWRSSSHVRLVTTVLARAAVLSIGFGLLYGQFIDRSFGSAPLNRVEVLAGLGTLALAALAAQLVANVAVGVLGSSGSRKRTDTWTPAADFAVFVVVVLAGYAALEGVGAIVQMVADWVVGSGEVPDWAANSIWYVVVSGVVGGVALLADFALGRFRS